MRTVLIAQADQEFAEVLANPLSAAGYHTITCPGPWPPALRCIRCDVGYCPLTEQADLLIYDPDLLGYDAQGNPHRLAAESAAAEAVPLLLAWPGPDEPATAAEVLARVPTAARAARDPADLVDQVRRLIGDPFAPPVLAAA